MGDFINNNLKKFCEDLYVDVGKQLEKSDGDDEDESRVLLSLYQEKCKSILSAIKALKENISQSSTHWKDIAQLVLDVTYVEEVNLVEDEFPEDTAESRMKCIINSLSSLEALVISCYPDKNIIDCLGSEVVECLRWRKGALMYMFCHTVQSRLSGSKFPPQYVHYLEGGVDYLVKMLKTRGNPIWLDGCVAEDSVNHPSGSNLKKDTLQLIEEGIFSDTHLLALMYCGDLCFWRSNISYSGDYKDEIAMTSNSRASSQSQGDIGHANKSRVRIVSEESSNLSSHGLEDCQCGNSGLPLSSAMPSQQVSGASVDIDSHTERVSHSCAMVKGTDDDVSVIDKKFHFVSIGNACLKKYLSITNGPLSGAGWDSSRAKELIIHFEKLKM